MRRKNLNGVAAKMAGMVLSVMAVLGVFDETALAGKTKLTLQDAPLTILKDTTTTKKINGIANNTPGRIDIRIKWHVMTFIPNVFNKLKIELMHGSRVLLTDQCYSKHSDKEPKCYLFKTVDQTEANASGDWKLRVTNNTVHDVNGFNIEKEVTDLNPTVMFVDSTFEPDCTARGLTLQGGGSTHIAGYSSVERELYGIENRGGEVHIRAKWHTDVITPNVFNRLKVEVLRSGSLIQADYGYSIHSNEKDKLSIKFTVSANQTGVWKLRITNGESSLNIKEFNIEKGFDSSPFVPQFKSTFKPACN